MVRWVRGFRVKLLLGYDLYSVRYHVCQFYHGSKQSTLKSLWRSLEIKTYHNYRLLKTSPINYQRAIKQTLKSTYDAVN